MLRIGSAVQNFKQPSLLLKFGFGFAQIPSGHGRQDETFDESFTSRRRGSYLHFCRTTLRSSIGALGRLGWKIRDHCSEPATHEIAGIGNFMEGKRSSSSGNVRIRKEQRRSPLSSSCFYALAVLWAVIISSCYLRRGVPLPPLRAEQGTFGNQPARFLSFGSGDELVSGPQREAGGREKHWLWRLLRPSITIGVKVGDPGSSSTPLPGDGHLERVVRGPNVSTDGMEAVQGFGSAQKVHDCASVEEMGEAAAGDTREASLGLRRAIRSYLAEHGAGRVRRLPPHLFCRQNFVLGKALEDGFGNNMYKLLTAAGLGVILNRSLIIGEGSATNPAYLGTGTRPLRLPFGDYLEYSNQAFSMREVKRLWAANDCTGRFQRPLSMKVDDFMTPSRSSVFCEDWTQWDDPILWFKDTQDAVALQFLLKNRHGNVQTAAARLLGDPARPNSRPNAFGELMVAFVAPKAEVEEAIEWALRGGKGEDLGGPNDPPDVALHLRMRGHSSSTSGLEAAISCSERILGELLPMTQKRARVVVASDTPSVVRFIQNSSLARSADIFGFDYEKFLSRGPAENGSSLRADAFLPPLKRKTDWGPLPRWVAVVDFFLAARARHAVVSGAHRRVTTTYAQLVGSVAEAYTLLDEQERRPAKLYSSFQEGLLLQGLASQAGWGHSWRPFGGRLSCKRQPQQCAVTPLLPYAWWDAPWQSPLNRDRSKMRQWGIRVESDGSITANSLRDFCHNRKSPSSILLDLPKAKS